MVVHQSQGFAEPVGQEGVGAGALRDGPFVDAGDDQVRGIVEGQFQPAQEFHGTGLRGGRGELVGEASEGELDRLGEGQSRGEGVVLGEVGLFAEGFGDGFEGAGEGVIVFIGAVEHEFAVDGLEQRGDGGAPFGQGFWPVAVGGGEGVERGGDGGEGGARVGIAQPARGEGALQAVADVAIQEGLPGASPGGEVEAVEVGFEVGMAQEGGEVIGALGEEMAGDGGEERDRPGAGDGCAGGGAGGHAGEFEGSLDQGREGFVAEADGDLVGRGRFVAGGGGGECFEDADDLVGLVARAVHDVERSAIKGEMSAGPVFGAKTAQVIEARGLGLGGEDEGGDGAGELEEHVSDELGEVHGREQEDGARGRAALFAQGETAGELQVVDAGGGEGVLVALLEVGDGAPAVLFGEVIPRGAVPEHIVGRGQFGGEGFVEAVKVLGQGGPGEEVVGVGRLGDDGSEGGGIGAERGDACEQGAEGVGDGACGLVEEFGQLSGGGEGRGDEDALAGALGEEFEESSAGAGAGEDEDELGEVPQARLGVAQFQPVGREVQTGAIPSQKLALNAHGGFDGAVISQGGGDARGESRGPDSVGSWGYALGTMETNDRIAQWEKMVREAPDDMAWFSLGNAYRDAGRLAEADAALAKAVGLNAGMSRAYQLRAQVLIQLGRLEEAGEVAVKGYTIAAQRGDVMPQRAMGALLEKLGRPVPRVETEGPERAAASVAVGADMIVDRKTGRPGTRMKEPPMRGPVGQIIQQHYSHETWQMWIRQGTKVINELRLDFSNPDHAKVYDTHMMEWLGISEDEVKGK